MGASDKKRKKNGIIAILYDVYRAARFELRLLWLHILTGGFMIKPGSGYVHIHDSEGKVVAVYEKNNALYPAVPKQLSDSDTVVASYTRGKEAFLAPRGEDPDPNRPQFFFDHEGVRLIGLVETPRGVLVLYETTVTSHEKHRIGGALFEVHGLSWRQIWRSEIPLVETSFDEARIRSLRPKPARSSLRGNRVTLVWSDGAQVFTVTIHDPFADLEALDESPSTLARFPQNPIITADETHTWESLATFNPAAIYINNQVHLLYRAVGHSGQSVVGHAISDDGLHFTRRDTPAYVPHTVEEGVGVPREIKTPDYRSPSWGPGTDGAEDPRATVYEGRVHMYYAAFNGWQQARSAGISISVDDFLAERFTMWSEPVYLTAPPTHFGTGGKNAALMPGKTKNGYTIFHRIWPDICIDYTNALDLSEYTQPNRWLEAKERITVRPAYWDSGKVAVGAPPIETREGWLLIYTGVSQQTHDGYKVGAMILDSNDPAKVLYRTTRPILSPRAWYEKSGLVANITYPCGAVVKDGILYVYYGGADTYVCVATIPLEQFIEAIKNDSQPELIIERTDIRNS